MIPPPGPKAVEKEEKEKEIKLVVEMNEEVIDKEEIYPLEPNPWTVETKLLVIPIPETVEVIVEANSLGSMNVLMYVSKPLVVENSDNEEI